MQLLNELFGTSGQIPHGYCLQWNPSLVWTLVISDIIIAISYFSIPFAIWLFAKKRPDIPHRWLFALFGLFIVACGITHFFDVLTIWRPNYWANAIAKAITAILSLGTALVLWRIMPSALLAPSVAQLVEAKNQVEFANANLERRVQERTEELRQSSEQFRAYFERSMVGMATTSIEKGWLNVNDALCDSLGYSREELMRMTWVELTYPEDIAPDLAQFNRLLSGEINNYALDKRFIHKDGRLVYTRLVVSCVLKNDGSVDYVIALVEDITAQKQSEATLKDSEAKLCTLYESTSEAVMLLDENGFLDCNKATLDLFGCASKEEFCSKTPAELSPLLQPCGTDSMTLANQYITQAMQSGRAFFEWSHETIDTHQPFFADVLLTVMDIKGKKVIQAIVRNITARKQSEEKLQLAASVFTHAGEGILITDATGTIIDVNDTFTYVTGYERAEAIGQNPRMLQSGRQGPEFYAAMWQALTQSGQWRGEVWNRRKDGEVYAELLTISAVNDAQGKIQHYVALFTDLTHIKLQQQQLERMAHYDILTNLPNRVLLADRLQQAMAQSLRRKQSLAVVFLDLDGFKAVNDQHGHAVGDELLIALALRMKLALRDGDTLARIGGDEFIAVLVDLESAQDAEPILTRLLEATSGMVRVDNKELKVSASIGVTLYPQDGVEPDQLMRHADQAMYQAKQSGKNRYHLFDVAQNVSNHIQQSDWERMRHALHQRELVLYYQPKVNMRTGAVVGAEALIRWQHPERGLLPPSAFLPSIENHPISVEVGEWVINTALSQIAQWQAAGLNIPISVNISAYQLQRDNFTLRLSQILAAHPEVKPASLELEILETSALEDVTQTAEIMSACHALGVRFALDDFGTGYSSLTYLRRLPADTLKIDQSFVRDMLDDPDDLAIVEGVVGLATAFSRHVIAEGVETMAHGELLLPLGCELAQGYGIARPMLAADFPQWAATWRPDPTWAIWRNRTPNRDDVAVVFAEVEHRHWLRTLDTFVSGDLTTPLPGAHESHFVRWLETDGLARYGDHPDFPVVVSMHDRLQVLGKQLIDLSIAGEQLKAKTLLGEVDGLRDEFIETLKGVVRG